MHRIVTKLARQHHHQHLHLVIRHNAGQVVTMGSLECPGAPLYSRCLLSETFETWDLNLELLVQESCALPLDRPGSLG